MKKIILLVLIAIITTTISTALNEDLIYSAEEIQTKLTINSNITLLKTDPNYKISTVEVNLSFIPQETENQQVISITYNPKPKIIDGQVVYSWEDIDLGTYSFGLEAELKNTINFKKIRQKISFPIQDLPSEYLIYTKQSEKIDSENPEIIKKASEIAAGQDDLYSVTFELVKWIKSNIRYDLNTFTAEATQKASWVLENKYGVCDEITTLFIAMARSLGIPARYISGMAYTNWNNMNDWGPHAWAEVYFPGQGWVAFDITYGEFGYVDASHIILKESLDSSESSTHYEWRGRNIDVDAKNLDIKVEQLSKQGNYEDNIKITVQLLKTEVGFGSYNLVQAEIENLADYYTAEELAIAKVEEVKVIGEERKQVLLKPKEKKKIQWIINVIEDLKPNYIYTLPIKVYNIRNNSAETEFTSMFNAKKYSEAEMTQAMQQTKEEETKTYSRQVSLNCTMPKEAELEKQTTISCNIKNSGNTPLENIQICLEQDCKTTDLGITQEQEITFTITPPKTGKQELTITAKNNYLSKASYLSYEALDKPAIKINGLDHPTKLDYGQQFKIAFVIDKTSYTNPKNVVITLEHNKARQEWRMEQLNNSQEFFIDANSKDLAGGDNNFNIKIEYADDKNNKYDAEQSFTITVEATRFLDKIKLWINKIEYFLQGLFS